MKTLMIAAIILLPIVVRGQRMPIINREIKLEGAVNFRDLGGYTTTEMRRLKMGRVYRAADISKLTDADMEELKRRHIYTVIDFRGEEEARQAPDRLLPGADYTLCPAGSGNTNDFAAFAGDNASGRDLMIAFYSDISSFKEKYRPFFYKLITLPDTSAMVFHCSAGKDRTGIAAALFLYAMNVPMETIISDYVSTNIYRAEENKKMIDELVENYHISKQMATEIMAADPIYIQTTFNVIIRRYGSIETFLYQEIGLDENVLLVLREKFLQ